MAEFNGNPKEQELYRRLLCSPLYKRYPELQKIVRMTWNAVRWNQSVTAYYQNPQK